MGHGTIAIALATAAISTASAAPAPIMNLPAYGDPATPWSSVDDAIERATACRNRIEQARAAAGKPRLDREPASPDEPLLMYAVDRRLDGCGVLVPVGDPAAVRVSPRPGKPAFRPLGPTN